MKKRTVVFTVILGVMLVLGLGLTGCQTEEDSGGGGNPFAGNYTSNVAGNQQGDTLIMLESSWSSNDLGNGTYTRSGTTATLSQGGQIIGSATLSGTTLLITITNGDNEGNYTYIKNAT
jgi:hypothetical protein